MNQIENDVLQEMLERRKKELASCERMLELLQPEWDKFEARTGHDVYVARDYADHFSAARTHRKEIAALEAAIAAMPVQSEPVAWMYTYTVQYQPKLECTKKLAPVISLSLARWENVVKPWTETPLYAHPPAQWQGIESASDAEITRLTEALRAAEEREKALLSALEEWMFRYFWRVDGMPVEAARIHAQSRMKIAALAGGKP